MTTEDTPPGPWCMYCGDALPEPGHMCEICEASQNTCDIASAIGVDPPAAESEQDPWVEPNPWAETTEGSFDEP